MSRYQIPGHDPQDEITVGWDAPLQTFFCVAISNQDEDADEEPKLWVGCSWKEIASVDLLAHAIASVASIPDPIAEVLRAEAGTGRPTDLQRSMGRALDGSRL